MINRVFTRLAAAAISCLLATCSFQKPNQLLLPNGKKKTKNTVLEKLLIEDFAAEGKSLGRWQGKVVFVERTVPGDVVDVFLYKNKKDWAEGYPLVFHEYSKKGWSLFAVTLATVAVANGNRFHIKNNYVLSSSKCRMLCKE
jgi:hypothetical protein